MSKLKIKKYAAVDIGSNGVRLLVSNIVLKAGKEPVFRKSALVRVPIRLGADVFKQGIISERNTDRMCQAMKAFDLLMQVHGVEKYRACATSAMREAGNGKDIVQRIRENTGISIDIIDGKTEAEIIAATDLYEVIEKRKNYLYVDVGGGSTEFTFFSKGKRIKSKSFKMGTVRSLQHKENVKKVRQEAKLWVKNEMKSYRNIIIIGSGGNINKVYKLSGVSLGKPLTQCYIKQEYKALKKMTYDERVREMGLNPDRADVIIPALKIYLSAMKWSNAREMIVPKIGLADGMIKLLYAQEQKH